MAVFASFFLGVVIWFISIPPSHNRPWRPEVAVMPRAFIDGDRVRLTGVRNFDFRDRDDFTVRYEEREIDLSRLTGLARSLINEAAQAAHGATRFLSAHSG